MTQFLIIAEKNSPSDDQLTCLEVFYQNGGFVLASDVVAEMEGAKAIFEIMAGAEGYFYSFVRPGQKISVGEVIGLVSIDELTEEGINQLKSTPKNDSSQSEGRALVQTNMSSAAMKIFEGLDQDTRASAISHFSSFPFVRETDLLHYVNSLRNQEKYLSKSATVAWRKSLYETKELPSIYFVGGGFGALQVLDVLLTRQQYNLAGYFSDFDTNVLDEIGVARIGECTEQNYIRLLEKNPDCAFVVTVGTSPEFRFNQVEMLRRLNADLPNIIHPSVVLGRNLEIGVGNVVFANVHIGADVSLGNGNFISSNSTIEHHNALGSGNCFGPQIATSGNVKIGDMCRFGAGIVVEPKIVIGTKVTIASNVAITSNIYSRTVVKATNNSRVISDQSTFD
jgi:acetyltransferase EpsM